MALNCKINGEVTKDCALLPGGVKTIALINYSDIKIADTGEPITATDITLAQGAKFYVWETATDTTNAQNTLQTGANPDQKSFQQTVAGTIVGYPEAFQGDDLINSVLADVVIAVKENSGKTFIYGANNGLKANQFDYATGSAGTDLNGTTFSFQGTAYQAPILLDDSFSFEDLVKMVGA